MNKSILDTVNDVITKNRSTNSYVELELRFKNITREVFYDVYRNACENFTALPIERTVNIISRNNINKKDGVSYIQTVNFDGTKVIESKFSLKSSINKPIIINDYIKYSINISKESPSGPFKTDDSAMVRFKTRASFKLQSWRLDLTIVNEKPNVGKLGSDSLKILRNRMFSLDIADIDPSDITSYEIELEYTEGSIITDEDMKITKTIFSMINPNYLEAVVYQDEIKHIADHILPYSMQDAAKNINFKLKQLLNQVVSLSKYTYYNEVFGRANMLFTVKADGERAALSINGNRYRLITNEKLVETVVGDTFVPGKITILDVEIIDKAGELTLRVFDIMVLLDDNIADIGIEERANYLDKLHTVGGPYKLVPATYISVSDITEYRNACETIWNQDYYHAKDGIILSVFGNSYHETKNYKWKPYEFNTIDFYAIKCPQKFLNKNIYDVVEGYELYLLFVGVENQMRKKIGLNFMEGYKELFPTTINEYYYPVQFSPSANPTAYLYYHKKGDENKDNENIHGSIIELGRDIDNKMWVFHRQRLDRKSGPKYYGNDFRIAEATYSNYIDRFNFEDLWLQNTGYFASDVGNIHYAPNKFKRFVISIVLKENISGAKKIIDAAGGRGADMGRYNEINVGHALFIDIDATAISELIARKFSYFRKKTKTGGNNLSLLAAYDKVHDISYDHLFTKEKPMTVHTLVADLTQPHAEIIAATRQFGYRPGEVEAIICNFALHYMCDTAANLQNFLIFCSRMMAIGGKFIFNVMDGASIFTLLKPLGRNFQWTSLENDVVKYAIEKRYDGKTLSAAGQMIAVKLPFSSELVPEPLCNIAAVINEAKKLGFKLKFNTDISEYLPAFEASSAELFARLTAEDIKYIGLFRCVCLEKVKEMKK